jgi:hypothetical protein
MAEGSRFASLEDDDKTNVNIHTKKNGLNNIFFYQFLLQMHTHENVLVLKKSIYKVD